MPSTHNRFPMTEKDYQERRHQKIRKDNTELLLLNLLSLTHLHRLEKHFPGTSIIVEAIAQRRRLPFFLSAEPENCDSWQQAACRMFTNLQIQQLLDSLRNDECTLPAYLQEEIDRREHLA